MALATAAAVVSAAWLAFSPARRIHDVAEAAPAELGPDGAVGADATDIIARVA